MLSLNWSEVAPDDFEELVFQLLGELKFVNREWFRGPGDRGRDIRATTILEDLPGHVETLKWIVECKRYTRSVSPSDLRPSIDWTIAHRPDRYLLATTSWLTPDTKDWLEQVDHKYNIRCQVLEGSELEELARRYEPQKYLYLLETQSGGPVPAHQAVLRRLSAAFAREPHATVADLAREIASTVARLGGDRSWPMPAASLGETHDVQYLGAGLSRTSYRLTVANLGESSLTHDTFRLYADMPVADNATLNLAAHLASGHQLEDVRFQFDNGYLKVIEFFFPEPVSPLGTLTYQFSFDWPVLSPLTGPRYYSTYARRPKRQVDVTVGVPEGFCISRVLPLAVGRGMSRRIWPHGLERESDARSCSVSYGPLLYGEQLLIAFDVYEC